jgi:hypothetical protein
MKLQVWGLNNAAFDEALDLVLKAKDIHLAEPLVCVGR